MNIFLKKILLKKKKKKIRKNKNDKNGLIIKEINGWKKRVIVKRTREKK